MLFRFFGWLHPNHISDLQLGHASLVTLEHDHDLPCGRRLEFSDLILDPDREIHLAPIPFTLDFLLALLSYGERCSEFQDVREQPFSVDFKLDLIS